MADPGFEVRGGGGEGGSESDKQKKAGFFVIRGGVFLSEGGGLRHRLNLTSQKKHQMTEGRCVLGGRTPLTPPWILLV